jgi:hypothetical protein
VHPFAPSSSSLPTPQSQLPNLASYKKLSPYIYVNAATKTAVLEMVSGATPANSGFSYDGYYNGQANFTIPVGWSVILDFSNRSGTPHSLLLTKSLKGQLVPAALPGQIAPAATPNPIRGLSGAGLTQQLTFLTRVPGKYYVTCGVPGHVQAGMFDYLTVSTTAKTPRIVVGKPTSYTRAAAGQPLR